MPCYNTVPISIIPPTSLGGGALVWQNGSQINRLNNPLNPSWLIFDGKNTRWGDGSIQSPIFLPNLQLSTLTNTSYLIGLNQQGTLIKAVPPPPLNGNQFGPIYIAIRPDGAVGNGSQIDPYDGSTTARFDGIMGSLPSNSVVILGPGTFPTKGTYNNGSGGWICPNGLSISGAGKKVTTIQLQFNGTLPTYPRTSIIGGKDNQFAPINNVNISDLTLDANYFGNTPSVTFTGNTTSVPYPQNTITNIPSVTGLVIGQVVIGYGISDATTITGIGANSITLSNPITKSAFGSIFHATAYANTIPSWNAVTLGGSNNIVQNCSVIGCSGFTNSQYEGFAVILTASSSQNAYNLKIINCDFSNFVGSYVQGPVIINNYNQATGYIVYNTLINNCYIDGTNWVAIGSTNGIISNNITNNCGFAFRWDTGVIENILVDSNDFLNTIFYGVQLLASPQINNSVTFTGTTTSGSAVINSISSIVPFNGNGLAVGQYVTGNGIPTNTQIVLVTPSTGTPTSITLSQSATASASGVSFTTVCCPITLPAQNITFCNNQFTFGQNIQTNGTGQKCFLLQAQANPRIVQNLIIEDNSANFIGNLNTDGSYTIVADTYFLAVDNAQYNNYCLTQGNYSNVKKNLNIVGSTIYLDTSFATTTDRGLNRKIYVSNRADQYTGSGTENDPYNAANDTTGGTFDAILQGLPSTGYHLILEPGVYYTACGKNLGGGANYFTNGSPYKIQGSGVGVTTIKIANGTLDNSFRNGIIFTNGSNGYPSNFELSDITFDCNIANQLVSTNNVISAIAIIANNYYRIVTLDSTNWSSIGAGSSPFVGQVFQANSTTPTGTGTVVLSIPLFLTDGNLNIYSPSYIQTVGTSTFNSIGAVTNTAGTLFYPSEIASKSPAGTGTVATEKSGFLLAYVIGSNNAYIHDLQIINSYAYLGPDDKNPEYRGNIVFAPDNATETSACLERITVINPSSYTLNTDNYFISGFALGIFDYFGTSVGTTGFISDCYISITGSTNITNANNITGIGCGGWNYVIIANNRIINSGYGISTGYSLAQNITIQNNIISFSNSGTQNGYGFSVLDYGGTPSLINAIINGNIFTAPASGTSYHLLTNSAASNLMVSNNSFINGSGFSLGTNSAGIFSNNVLPAGSTAPTSTKFAQIGNIITGGATTVAFNIKNLPTSGTNSGDVYNNSGTLMIQP